MCIRDRECTSASISHIEGEDVKIYPNPTKSSITIESNEFKQCEVFLLDPSGRIVLALDKSLEVQEIELSKLIPGAYFIELRTERKSAILKLIKE